MKKSGTTFKKTLVTGATALGSFGITLHGGIAAAQDAAVSNVNGKLSFGYTAGEGDTMEGVFSEGALSFPIARRVGGQIDLRLDDQSANGVAGSIGGTFGYGAHLFLRDPQTYLLGLYGHVLETDTPLGSRTSTRYGVEGEFYLQNVTLSFFAGEDVIEGAGTAKSYDAFEGAVDYYFTDNTMGSAVINDYFGDTGGGIGVTHLITQGSTPFGLFGMVEQSSGDTAVTLGATVYFGNAGKTLKEIHRTSDPRTRMKPGANYLDALRDFNSTLGVRRRPPVFKDS